ncbi:MAG: hypothetical protein EPN46_08505 [Candidimonas sp.]|nr:MAG: hypothetical protein EPN77_17645 [Candidimonas sp.]TAM19964.1 MAG: hypothetical protein EPN62_17510 [Candidimonas sp.]TAM76422.1 MAG: hypothetical protein EPN46_08505 [Candidimonas sp.]
MASTSQLHWVVGDLRISVGPSSSDQPWSLDVDVTRASTGQVESMLWDANAPHGLIRREVRPQALQKRAPAFRERDLLILADQGVGDIVQQWRYVPSVARQFRRVRVQCRPELQRLLRRQSPEIETMASGESRDDSADVHVSIMRLGSLSRDSSRGNAYLATHRPKPAPGNGRLRVGLNWITSNVGVAADVKSLPPVLFEHVLRDYPGVDWVSVQWGDDERWLSRQPWAATVEQLGGTFADVADLADGIAGLDLLISSDSAPAHLAGALGVPVWTLLSRPCSWRWGLVSPTTPLYSSMRLVRQTKQGDWSGVMAQIHRMLASILRLSGQVNFLLARPWEDMPLDAFDERATSRPDASGGNTIRSTSLDEALRICRENADWRAAFVFYPIALLEALGVPVWGRDYSGLAKVFKAMVDCHEGFSWCTPLRN